MPDQEVIPEVKDFGYREDSGEIFIPDAADDPLNTEVTEEEKPEVKEEIKPTEEPVAEGKPAEEIKPVEEPAKPEEKPVVAEVDWKAAIKKADKWEALKELGYDEFTINLLKYKDSTGDVTPYLQAKTVDYSKMTPEQLIKLDMQRQNPGMSDKALNFKFNKEFSEKYYLNREDYPEDGEEAEYGQEQLRIDAEQKRKALIEEQQKFKAPEPTPDLEQAKREAELQQQRASLVAAVMNNDATKNLQTSKSLVFGEGEESFNYPVTDTQLLVDAALSAILSSGRTDLTGVDMNIFFKQLAYGANPAGIEKAFAAHQQAVAKKKFQSELQNITPIKGEPPEIEKDLTPAQQLARYGKLT